MSKFPTESKALKCVDSGDAQDTVRGVCRGKHQLPFFSPKGESVNSTELEPLQGYLA